MAWEYLTIKTDTDWSLFTGPTLNCAKMNYEMNRLGRENWELISSIDINASHGKSVEVVMIFKRPRLD